MDSLENLKARARLASLFAQSVPRGPRPDGSDEITRHRSIPAGAGTRPVRRRTT